MNKMPQFSEQRMPVDHELVLGRSEAPRFSLRRLLPSGNRLPFPQEIQNTAAGAWELGSRLLCQSLLQ